MIFKILQIYVDQSFRRENQFRYQLPVYKEQMYSGGKRECFGFAHTRGLICITHYIDTYALPS